MFLHILCFSFLEDEKPTPSVALPALSPCVCYRNAHLQGSKGQEGELFGIQNLLKFSDDSLLKTLRAKYAASAAAAVPGAALAVEADVADSSNRNRKKEYDHKLRGSKVDTADGAELMSAMQEAVGKAKEEMKDGEIRGKGGRGGGSNAAAHAIFFPFL